MAELVTGEWTPIGTEGFEYYWAGPVASVVGVDQPCFLWRHPETGYQARAGVAWEDCSDEEYLGYLLERRTWDVEKSFLGLAR